MPRLRSAFGPLLLLLLLQPQCRGQGVVRGITLEGSALRYNFENGVISADGAAVPRAQAERVKRVALFLLSLEREPFFLSPATDLGGLGAAASELAAQEKLLLRSSGLEGGIYPAGFLESYAEASSAFDSFRLDPSEKKAFRVLGKIKEGVRRYAAAAALLGPTVRRIYDETGVDVLAGLGGENAFDRATVLADIELIKDNAAAAAGRLTALEKCLSSSADCRLKGAPVPFPSAAGPAVSSSSILGLEKLGMAGAAARGPYLVDTPCWGGKKKNYLYAYEMKAGPQGGVVEWDLLATNWFFRDYSSLATGRKYKLFPITPTTTYDCNDGGYKPALRALDHFAVRYSGKPALAGLNTAALNPAAAGAAAEAARLEAVFGASDFKSQEDLERLGAAYARAFEELGRDHPAAGEELLARARLIALKTTGFGLIVRRAALHLGNNNARGAARGGALHSKGAILSRLQYGLFFMPFSPSVWVLPRQPRFLADYQGARSPIFVDYRRAVELYGEPEVDRVVRQFAAMGEWDAHYGQ